MALNVDLYHTVNAHRPDFNVRQTFLYIFKIYGLIDGKSILTIYTIHVMAEIRSAQLFYDFLGVFFAPNSMKTLPDHRERPLTAENQAPVFELEEVETHEYV